MNSRDFEAAAAATSELYRSAGRFTHGYVRGKLLRDPVFRQLAERAPFRAPVIDLGCGRGQTELLLAKLDPELHVLGFDWDEDKLELARQAAARAGLQDRLRFEPGDLRSLEAPRAGTLLMLDVLHYNPLEIQDEMLRRACAALESGGRLFVREADADGSWRSRATIWQERITCKLGLNRGATLVFRSADSIEAVLRDCGLECQRQASWGGTPLANVLIEARRPG